MHDAAADFADLLPPAQALTRFVPEAGALGGAPLRRNRDVARYGFTAAGLGLLIAPLTASEAVAHARVAPIPRCAPWVVGVMNLRGNPVPVFDLDAVFGLAAHAPRPRNLVLVLDKGPAALGLAIEAPPRAVRPEKRIDVPVALPARLQPFVSSAIAAGEDVWLEFDHAGLFTSLREGRGAA